MRPVLEHGDAEDVVRVVEELFSPYEVAQFLQHTDADVRRVAAFTMGLIGDGGAVGVMSRLLHDPDETVAKMAEHGLWSIWFRGGCPTATESFTHGVELLADDRLEAALAELEDAASLDPEFAEAYNQCAICLYLLGRYEPAIERCKQALARVPAHFGAMAGMGHCHAHLGRFEEALICYRRALAINPRIPCAGEAIASIEAKLAGEGASPVSTPDKAAVRRYLGLSD